MKVLTSYSEALRSLSAGHRFTIAHLHGEDPKTIPAPRCCQIYYAVSGALTCMIDEKIYRIESGNLFMISQYENHQILLLNTRQPHERIIFMIYPPYLEELSTPQTDLTYCFTYRPRKLSHRLVLTPEQQRRFLYYLSRVSVRGEVFGSDLAEQCAFTELMLFLTDIFRQTNEEPEEEAAPDTNFNGKVAEIKAYIHKNIAAPLSIGDIASHLYLSGPYLCRLFKKCTGTTVLNYITARRIEMAMARLEDGHSVSEVCGMCGFNDYSNFFKAFKKHVGLSPKEYSQNCLKQS